MNPDEGVMPFWRLAAALLRAASFPTPHFQATLPEHRTTTVSGSAHAVPLGLRTRRSLCLESSSLTPQPSHALHVFKDSDNDVISFHKSFSDLKSPGRVSFLCLPLSWQLTGRQ